MRRRKSAGDEGWLLSYADLITNLLLFFVLMLTAANISRSKMQQIAQSISGKVNPKSLESIAEEIEEEIAAKNLRDLLSTEITLDGLELRANRSGTGVKHEAAVQGDLE
ncbi:MAG: flagellar motor protein MotB, partial [Myxococcota bacterium]